MTPVPLTARQQQVLDYVSKYMQTNEIPPTIREIGKALGINSTTGVLDHLIVLEKKGWIIRGMNRSRDIQLTPIAKRELDFESPRCFALNEKRALDRLVAFVKETPGDVIASVKKAGTPIEGAMVMLDTVREILERDLGRIK